MDAAVVAEALGAEVETVGIAGGTRFQVVCGEATAKFDLHDGWVNWVALDAPQRSRWADRCVRFAKAVLPAHGVGYVQADPADDRARKMLERRGFEVDETNRLRLTVG